MDPLKKDLLAGKTTLFTGGGSGLGRSMALRLASLGARVALFGRRPEPLQQTAAEIEKGGGQAAAIPCDIRDTAALIAAFDAAEKQLGPINQLINNAAGNFLCPSEDVADNGFDSVVKIVLYGSFHCTRELGRRLIAAKQKGEILSIVTTYCTIGSAFVLPSAAAKAGVLAMTRSLAVEWAAYGIRLNAIAPGPVPTEGAFSRLMPDPQMTEMAKNRVPLKRFGTPREIADAAVFLISDGAAYVTGD